MVLAESLRFAQRGPGSSPGQGISWQHPMKPATYHIEGGDGLELFVRDGGKEDGPPILLIHGWSQHHLAWEKQMNGPLAERFRLVAFDLRGHGASDKPDDPEYYLHSKSWADDVAAVIEACELQRPLLVGWSLGGRIVQDYVYHHGCDAVSGLVLVGNSVKAPSDPAVIARRRPDMVAEGMYSEDQRVALDATIAFVKGCFASPLSKMDLARMVGFNMLVPPHIRRAARLRAPDFEPDFGKFTCPLALFWGEAERLVFRDMIDETLAVLPHAKLVTFPGTGHAPFWERAEDFDRHLAEFATETMGVAA